MLIAVADAALVLVYEPHHVLFPSGARVLFVALLVYPVLAAAAGFVTVWAVTAATRRRSPAEFPIGRIRGASSGAAALFAGVSWVGHYGARVASPNLPLAAALVLAATVLAVALGTRFAGRRHRGRRAIQGRALAWLALTTICGGVSLLPPGPQTRARTGGGVVILITADTLRADALGCYGNSGASTPNIDLLAADGTRFANAVAQSSWTLAGHASIMTGLTVGQHGADAATMHLESDRTTIATILAHRGYRTAAIVSSFFTGWRFGLGQGFELFDDEMSPRWLGLRVCTLARRLGIAPRAWLPAEERRAASVDNVAVRLLRRYGDGPLFMWLHYFDPHTDYDPPAPFAAAARRSYQGAFDGTVGPIHDVNRGLRRIAPEDVRHLRDLYDGEVAYLDSEIGRLRSAIDRLGLADRTAIVLTADHGEAFLEHGTLSHVSLYQEILHVPLLIWSRGVVPAGAVVTSTVRQMDVAPTLAELAGVPWDVSASRAASLVPVARGVGETDRAARADREVGGLVEPIKGEQHALVEWPWKLITSTNAPPELYNLAADPSERVNLASTIQDRARAMATVLDAEPSPTHTAPRRPNEWLLRTLRSLGYAQ